jgi:hypothetical protein
MKSRDQVAVVTGSARGVAEQRCGSRGAAVCVNYAAHGVAAEELIARSRRRRTGDRGGGGRSQCRLGRGDGCPHRSETGSGDDPREQCWRGLARHLRPGAGRADAFHTTRTVMGACEQPYRPRLRERRARHGRLHEVIKQVFVGYTFLLIQLQWHAAR